MRGETRTRWREFAGIRGKNRGFEKIPRAKIAKAPAAQAFPVSRTMRPRTKTGASREEIISIRPVVKRLFASRILDFACRSGRRDTQKPTTLRQWKEQNKNEIRIPALRAPPP
jgi:hypothetical protein